MKFILTFLVLSLIHFKSFSQWVDVGNPITNYWSTDNVMALDTNGVLYYGCTENNSSNGTLKSLIKMFDGNNWINLNLDYDSTSSIDITEAIIDNNNLLNILYLSTKNIWVNNNYTHSIYQYYWRKYNNGVWETVTGNSIDIDTTQHDISCVFDDTNNLYCAITTNNDLIIKKWNGLNWINYSNQGLPQYKGRIKIAVSENDLFIALLNVLTFTTEVYKYNGSSWQMIGAPFNSGNQEVKLLNTANNNLHLIYNQTCVRLDKTNNQWISVGGSELVNKLNDQFDFKSDERSNLFLSSSQVSGDRARCYYFNGTHWENIGLSVSDSTAGETKIAVLKNKLYVGYNDFILSKAVVKKYNLSLGNKENSNSIYTILFYKNAIQINGNSLKNIRFNLFNLNGELIYNEVFSGNTKIENKIPAGFYVGELINDKGEKICVSKILLQE